MQALVLVGAGAILGANARYLLSVWAATRWGNAFPWGTFGINVSGSFALGLFLALVKARFGTLVGASLLVATGFIGSYTTFSTFAFETIMMARRRDHHPALANVIGSGLFGLLAAAAGVWCGTRLGGLAR